MHACWMLECKHARIRSAFVLMMYDVDNFMLHQGKVENIPWLQVQWYHNKMHVKDQK